jgi:hypothetical protein
MPTFAGEASMRLRERACAKINKMYVGLRFSGFAFPAIGGTSFPKFV